MNRHTITTAVLSLLLVSGCTQTPEEKETLHKLTPREVTIEVTQEQEQKKTPHHSFQVNITYPSWEDSAHAAKKAQQQISQHLQYYLLASEDTRYSSMDRAIDHFRQEYDSLITHFPETPLSYEFTASGKIISQQADLTSIQFDTYKYTGGAHGMHWTSYLNLNSQTGQQLPIDSIIADKRSLAKALEQALRKKYNMSATDNWEAFGFFINQFQWPRNIGFTPDSIKAAYNPYEIRSYADGIINITLPREAFSKSSSQ